MTRTNIAKDSVHTSFTPPVLISESRSNHSRTWFPDIPKQSGAVNKDPKQRRFRTGVPLNSIPCPGLPPKTAILVLCLSFINVLNIAQVEAHCPLLTATRSQRQPFKPVSANVPIATLLITIHVNQRTTPSSRRLTLTSNRREDLLVRSQRIQDRMYPV